MSAMRCPTCGVRYDWDIERCTLCGGTLDEVSQQGMDVIAVTEVVVPSIGHEDTPYWCALVRDPDGDHSIVKSGRPLRVGQTLAPEGLVEAERLSIGILGTGIMGKGLVELLLVAGHDVVWVGRSAESADTASRKVIERLQRVMDEDELSDSLDRLQWGTSMEGLATCDLVIEAIIEEVGPKKEWLRSAERHMRPDAIIATNTSGLPLGELATALDRPERFGCLHFFNPATRMRLVEVAVPDSTDEATLAWLQGFSQSLGKVPVTVKARPAFVVNRVLMPLINEAVRSLEEGAASAHDIDEAIRLGLNHPMGPLELADLIGLDVVVDIMDNLVDRTDDEGYAPRPLLRRMVAEGHLGRKSGQGFFDHRAPRA